MKHILLLAVAVVGPASVSAQTTRRIPLPPSQNTTGSPLPIAGAVWARDTLYVSGWLDPDRKTHTDTKSQTLGILTDLQKFLATQKLTMGDVVMLRVFLQGVPEKDGRADTAGMTAAYTQFFGTKEQPNIPARTTLQQILPAAASGALVEIDMVAVRP